MIIFEVNKLDSFKSFFYLKKKKIKTIKSIKISHIFKFRD